MNARKRYRRILLWIFGISVLFCAFFLYVYVQRTIPDRINVVVQEQEEFNFSLPMAATLTSESEEVSLTGDSNIPSDAIDLVLDEDFQIMGTATGDYSVSCKLFGLIPMKEIQVSVVNPQVVYPMGEPIGIYLETQGIMIVGTGTVADQNGVERDPARDQVQSGDYITAVNGEPISDKEELMALVAENGAAPVSLTIRRDSEEHNVSITPVQSGDNEFKLGIWVRDDTQGIGTLSYVTPDGQYGALGHGISDTDTGLLIESIEGLLYSADIHSIIKGDGSQPGSVCGTIDYRDANCLGEITRNCDAGIYGTLSASQELVAEAEAVPVGYAQDARVGEAYIRSSISGETRDYQIQILQVDPNNSRNKGLVFQVTDPDLLELTGGIVQGQSGSPILQDGKMIGAVTHVFLQDPTKGYGIFLEKMLEAASSG